MALLSHTPVRRTIRSSRLVRSVNFEEIHALTKAYWQLGRQALAEHPDSLTWASLLSHFGPWLKSMTWSNGPIGDEQPWITFPAMRFLRRIVSRQSKVFEYGAGGSTLFFAKRVSELVTVEHDAQWLDKTAAYVRERPKFAWRAHLEPPFLAAGETVGTADGYHYGSSDPAYANMSFERYARCIERYDRKYFDVILIDGRARVGCFKHALNHVKSGGYIGLDNAEREQYRHVESEARALGYRIMDFWGPGPYNRYFWRTILIQIS